MCNAAISTVLWQARLSLACRLGPSLVSLTPSQCALFPIRCVHWEREIVAVAIQHPFWASRMMWHLHVRPCRSFFTTRHYCNRFAPDTKGRFSATDDPNYAVRTILMQWLVDRRLG